MRRTLPLFAALLAALFCAAPAASASGGPTEPTLEARAVLPADASAAAPFPGAPDTDPAPAPGARQPVGGFSALIDAPGRDRYFAMPDNGFGSKANSRSFLLRLYEVEVDWETARGGGGEVEIEDWITLRDPDGKVPWDIVNEGTRDRLLTGGDFDVESVRRDRRGDLWFGEEFGPYLLHADARGRLKEAPIPLPGVRSPDAAGTGEANLARSNGFEGMALAADGRTLHPVLEGPVAGDDPTVRRVYTFDLQRKRYVGGWREYRVARPDLLVADFTLRDDDRYVALERDNGQGLTARHKQAFDVTLTRFGVLPKRRIADLLDLRDPARISLPGRAGDIGLGDPFSMPYQTIESVLPLDDGRLAIVNDTNFGSTGRNPALPDYSDFIVVATPPPGRHTRVTVATFNIHHGAGTDGQLDLERVAAEVERSGAEIVGLQEVDRHWSERSAFVDQAQWLAGRLGMNVAYGANLDLDPPAAGRPRRQYGTAILTSHPIVYSRNTLLPRPENGEQRGLLEAAVDVDGVRVRVADTHLQHTSAAERRAQTERIAALLRPVRTPIVLMGDLNAQPGTPELAPLSPRFADAWTRGGTGDGFTYPAEAPDARIDYVLTTADVDVRGARVMSSPASDHLPVIADLQLPRKRPPAPEPFDLQAHRGGLGLVTENTLDAFANALELGVTTLELDVQITEDQVAVVTHDRQVAAGKCRDTAPAVAGDPEFPYVGDYIRNLTLAQVRTLACDKPLPQHPQQHVVPDARMPLLSDVFALTDCYRAHDVRFNVETKVEAGAPDQTAPREQFVQIVAREVRDAGVLDRVTIQSFDWGALMRMREVEPRLPLVALTNGDFLQVGQPGASPWLGGIDVDDFGGSLVAAAASFGPDALSPVHGNPQDGKVGDPGYVPYTTRGLVADAHDAGLDVIPWTVDDPATMGSLIDAGIDGLITDYPDRLRAVLAERGLELPERVREPRGRHCL